jgi:hypothetical protein
MIRSFGYRIVSGGGAQPQYTQSQEQTDGECHQHVGRQYGDGGTIHAATPFKIKINYEPFASRLCNLL